MEEILKTYLLIYFKIGIIIGVFYLTQLTIFEGKKKFVDIFHSFVSLYIPIYLFAGCIMILGIIGASIFFWPLILSMILNQFKNIKNHT